MIVGPMKFIIFLVTLLCPLFVVAQTVVPKVMAPLYPGLSSGSSINLAEKATYISNSPQCILKKSKALEVLAVVYNDNIFNCNYYKVKYKGDVFFLNKDDVTDNSLIDDTHKSIILNYKKYQEDSLTYNLLKDIDKSKFYENNHRQYQIDSSKYAVKYDSIMVVISKHQNRLDSLNTIKESLADSILLEKNKEYAAIIGKTPRLDGLGKVIDIYSLNLSSPNSAAGCDVELYYTNNSPKTIKYLIWRGTIYNAVNDPVFCEIRNTSSFSGKDTGPIESGRNGGGIWENVIYNYSAKEIRLNSIHIDYMDGSSYNFNFTQAESKNLNYKFKYKQQLSLDKERISYQINKIVNTDDVEQKIREEKRELLMLRKPIKPKLTYYPSKVLQNDINAIKTKFKMFLLTGNYEKYYK